MHFKIYYTKGKERVVKGGGENEEAQFHLFFWSAGREAPGVLMFSDDDNFPHRLASKQNRKK